MLRIIEGAEAALTTLLRRQPWGSQEIPLSLRRRIKEAFGEELAPEAAVERIIAAVRERGDAALFELSRCLEGEELHRLEVSREEMASARHQASPDLIAALELAAERITSFHQKQRQNSWLEFGDGSLGQMIRPLQRVGLYAPGGTAPYPSTVLMTAIPARVAGVEEVLLASPPQKGGSVSPLVLAAADIAGVDRVFALGGAQAIAALAYGTESVPRVDKVCGPGGLFVTLAKKNVFGEVGIDGLHGPTETVLIADDSADPLSCALDLLAQAEHDVMATAVMITPSPKLAKRVVTEVEAQLSDLERTDIARAALEARGGIVLVDRLEDAFALANSYGPEHLCLLLADPWSYLGQVRNAGGVFLGEASAEAIADYTAGPSHVMPTGGTARFGSPLSLNDFIKITSLVALDEGTLKKLGPATVTLARAEGLTAHARAVEARLRGREGRG